MTEPPRRVRVTSPRTGATRRRRVTGASEIDAQTDLGEVYMTSLLRSQLRLALLVLGAVVVLVAGLPLVFTVFPGLVDVQVLGMPLPWVLLAFAVYPVLLGLGWLYVRAAERNERDFAEVVERP
ncbi:hypothetical protein KRR39_18675 [Nocardioides panacis]|uniref:DUF485 domain-containing protein n=1 Tax=Nocardioides panacis TaxID=2849501 RepID=A0A975SY85_9ACTN|nr:hypothetical protein [Nocardioides panacis]QWZ07449.1 hypothetical protein KRR39_18675 [Nocardioides panacis]